MKALIMMLFNTKEETYHPIWYSEKFLPGNPDDLTRYQSRGHLTVGIKDRDVALKKADELYKNIETNLSFTISKELEYDILWDGEEIPADNQIR